MEADKQLEAKQELMMEIEKLKRKVMFQVSPDMKLDDTINKNDMHMFYLSRRNVRESILRIVEEHNREHEELLKKRLVLDAKQKLMMEIDGLKEKLQVVKLSGDEDDTALQGQIKKMNDELEAKMKEMEVKNPTLA